MKADTIVAYTYKADSYCPDCITEVLCTGKGEEFDGWCLSETITMPTEENLTEIAIAFGIDRMDESSFDSGYFPKVVFADMVEDAEYCGQCGRDVME